MVVHPEATTSEKCNGSLAGAKILSILRYECVGPVDQKGVDVIDDSRRSVIWVRTRPSISGTDRAA
jgi:hypothetical protein